MRILYDHQGKVRAQDAGRVSRLPVICHDAWSAIADWISSAEHTENRKLWLLSLSSAATSRIHRDQPGDAESGGGAVSQLHICLLYTSDAADEEDSVDLGGRRI